jgi:hypothetical protein
MPKVAEENTTVTETTTQETAHETNGEATAVNTAAPKKVQKKQAAKAKAAAPVKTAAKKAPAKKTVVAKKADGKKVDRSMASIPAAEQRLAFLKLLRKLGAVSAVTAKPLTVIAEKLGYTEYNVYCLGYSKRMLAMEGFVKSIKLEGSRETSYYLTAKGAKTDPE